MEHHTKEIILMLAVAPMRTEAIALRLDERAEDVFDHLMAMQEAGLVLRNKQGLWEITEDGQHWGAMAMKFQPMSPKKLGQIKKVAEWRERKQKAAAPPEAPGGQPPPPPVEVKPAVPHADFRQMVLDGRKIAKQEIK